MAKKILVLDDEEHITSLVKAYLEKEGFTVNCALNGVEGLSLAKKEEFDLVILDIMMPEMDGYSFLREFRKEKIGRAHV